MRIELVRKNGNEFYFSNNYKYRMNARIISIDIDGTRVKQSDYKMIGPRGVKLNIPIDADELCIIAVKTSPTNNPSIG